VGSTPTGVTVRMSPSVRRRLETLVEREALVQNLSFVTKLPSVKQEWNRGFGAFLRILDFHRFSGTVTDRCDAVRDSMPRIKQRMRLAPVFAKIAQLVERFSEEEEVVGSIPTLGT
jgi:hypothetical protein